jgi:hypothetical protein
MSSLAQQLEDLANLRHVWKDAPAPVLFHLANFIKATTDWIIDDIRTRAQRGNEPTPQVGKCLWCNKPAFPGHPRCQDHFTKSDHKAIAQGKATLPT